MMRSSGWQNLEGEPAYGKRRLYMSVLELVTADVYVSSVTKSCMSCTQLDPAYQRMPSDATDEVGSGCLLLSHLRCCDDSAQLMLDYSTIATPVDADAVADSNTSSAVNIQLLKGDFFAVDL